jgi:hypothetical protein
MSTTSNRAYPGASFMLTPREVWLASLGAVVVTREWAQKEAGPLLRSLVKEGTIVEHRAVRMIGDRVETTFDVANTAWHRARRTVTSTVKSYADSAVDLAREIPFSLPHFRVPGLQASPAPAKRARRVVRNAKTQATGAAKKVRRTVKRAAKRA